MNILMRLIRFVTAASFLLFVAGCLAPAPSLRAPLPAGISAEMVAEGLKAESPVAVTRDGSFLALVRRDGLFLRSLADGREERISSELPIAVTFNPQGTELAAAFPAEAGSLLRRYSASSGELLAEISLSGRCEALLSREGEWLAFVTSVQTFRFGGNLRSSLLRWDGVHAQESSLLNDTTLDRSTLSVKESLLATLLRPQLSPYGDELLYLQLRDPPAFDPYLMVVLRHLETGSERLVAKLPKLTGAAVYFDGGDLVAYGDGIRQVNIVDPWQERVVARYPRPGALLASPLWGKILWVDDDLLHGDGQMLLSLDKESQPVSFLPDGRLLLRDRQGRLWLLRGLPIPSHPPVSPPASFYLLRKWRAEGLIDSGEFVERVQQERGGIQ